ncbi:hypothetical protein J3D55_004356 [Chryseobacterium ginsenosidimutans]|uniref:hypothetical protein n=1 Tax=Chryseobacterium ginsenosidimutans TaxID=687846 RepID=UPI00216795BE|nr:hypothetical protein [Chryseobacterium ginsenosidimutans]MCS3871440.1 hypothetical protein [Chryseobacterium ginsenosidimutans]
MKNNYKFLLFFLLSHFAFGQKINTIDCRIAYLPSIKYDNKTIQISKDQAKKIDSLISLKTFKITFTENDIAQIKELYNKKTFDGTKIYKISDSTYSKILSEKQIKLNFERIDTLPEKSIEDIITNVVDGAPFRLTAKTRKNKFLFENNFAGGFKFKELRKYLIFYSIYHNIEFCNPSNKIVKEYFSRENFLKTLIYCLTRIEAED